MLGCQDLVRAPTEAFRQTGRWIFQRAGCQNWHVDDIAPVRSAANIEMLAFAQESDSARTSLELLEYVSARRQRCMPDEIDLAGRREPADLIVGPLRHEEDRFREVHLCGDGLHLLFGDPFVKRADCGWIAGELPVGAGVDYQSAVPHRTSKANQSIVSSRG